MRLDRLLGAVDVLETYGDPAGVEVRAIAFDSREVRPASLFCCLRGETTDGHDYASEAVRAGASALLCERLLPQDVVQIRVAEGTARAAMAAISSALFDHPARDLQLVGVTGTNGKTTVVHMLEAVLEADGRPTAVVGTVGGRRTTPEAPILQAKLAAERAAGCTSVAIEVSSHALDQHRVDGIHFRAAVFTNLSRDHLDYHRSMEAYFEVKASLFVPERAELGVVSSDDAWGRRLLETATIPMRAFSLRDASDVHADATGARFVWHGERVSLPLGGRFNVANAIAAATTADALGVDPVTVASGLSGMAAVPGRMESVVCGQPFAVLVDYAHTPAGLEEVLRAARNGTGAGGRVLVAFGCGGDRDRGKRRAMGEVATRLADVVVVTSDNPRHEDPLAIIADVVAGASAKQQARFTVEPDRAEAIRAVLGEARPGDVVVLAGKGHETTQEIGGRRLDFDDRAVARAALERLSGTTE